MPLPVEALIARALTFVGYVERPTNVTPWGARAGYQGQPWCDSWVSCMAQDVGLNDVIPMSSYVPGRLAAARAAGQVVSAPRRGDLACFDWDHDGIPDHIGIVLDVAGEVIRTVEGNTSPDDRGSQSNGGGVYRRTRRRSQVGAFIRPPYPTEDDVPMTPDERAALVRELAEAVTGIRARNPVLVDEGTGVAELPDGRDIDAIPTVLGEMQHEQVKQGKVLDRIVAMVEDLAGRAG